MFDSLYSVWREFSFILLFMFATAFIAIRMPKRRYFALRMTVSAVVLIAMLYGLERLEDALGHRLFILIGGSKFVIMYFAVCAAVFFCFDCNVFATSFCATIGYAVQHIAQRMTTVVLRPFETVYHIFSFLTMISIFAITCFAIWGLSIRRRKSAYADIRIENSVQIVVATALILSIVYIELGFFSMRIGREAITFEHLMSSICALMVILLEINMLSKKHISDDFKQLQKLLAEEREKYVQEKANVEMINLKCHDIRHQIRAMQTKMDAEAIRELSDTINIYNTQIRTGNEAIDVVLATQGLYCLNHDIRLTCLIDGNKLSFIPDHELYAFFGNAIENAVHAVEKLEKEKRVISIAEKSKDGFVNISFTNFFEETLTFEEGLPVSRRENHGFGTRSMRMIVEKYGGRLNVITKDDLFELNAFFPIADGANAVKEAV